MSRRSFLSVSVNVLPASVALLAAQWSRGAEPEAKVARVVSRKPCPPRVCPHSLAAVFASDRHTDTAFAISATRISCPRRLRGT